MNRPLTRIGSRGRVHFHDTLCESLWLKVPPIINAPPEQTHYWSCLFQK